MNSANEFSLADLLIKLGESKAAKGLLTSSDVNCIGASQDTRVLRPGELFLALGGSRFRGSDFVELAAAAGAVAALTDEVISAKTSIPTCYVPSLRERLGEVAEIAYRTRESGMRLFAVTGTNGKTSTTTLLYRILRQLGVSAGLSASNLKIVGETPTYSNLTTPECLELHRSLFEMRAAGATAAAVEVSAHALVRNRVDGLIFEVSGFTNLARDHLDDFGNMESYRAAKAKLFTSAHSQFGVINVTDEHSKWVFDNAGVPCESIGEKFGWQVRPEAGKYTLRHRSGFEITRADDLSQIMAQNLSVALVMLWRAGFSVDALQTALERIDLQIPGRLERFELNKHSLSVYLDYAHTPAAVESAVASLAHYPELTVIIAASGNRDQGKRSEMGFASAFANRVIVTDQHPRHEDPATIRAAVKRGALLKLPPQAVFEEGDPEAALELALQITAPEGAILWCGPGDLDYREVGDEKIKFSARELLERRMSDA